MKNSCVETKNIKGNISNKNEGEFNNDKKIGRYVSTSNFLKKSISLNKFIIITKLRDTNATKKKDFKKDDKRYFMYVFILYFLIEILNFDKIKYKIIKLK